MLIEVDFNKFILDYFKYNVCFYTFVIYWFYLIIRRKFFDNFHVVRKCLNLRVQI